MKVPCGPKGVVHDYVPLYFSSLSPMLLAVIKKKKIDQEDIIYFEFPIKIVEDHDFVFTSAAANTEQPPQFYDNIDCLDLLTWNEIDSRSWSCSSDEIKQQRMAELLIYNKISLKEVKRIVVWSEQKKDHLIKLANDLKFALPQIQIKDVHERRHFFMDFAHGNSSNSCVGGPNETFQCWNTVVEAFKCRKIKTNYQFENIDDLLISLRRSLASIPYTKELIGLEVDNTAHSENVDQHVLSVVKNLQESSSFAKLSARNKKITEISAFLHDIGKGPKSKWEYSITNKKNNGKQKADDKHPLRATPMLIDIFCNYIKSIDRIDVNRITFLVLYHDYFGNVMGSRNQNIGDNRDPKELIDRFKYGSQIIDMLLTLSRADSNALSEYWWDDEKANKIRDILLAKA